MGAPEIKICGLTRRVDSAAAAEAGAAYGGVILAPGGRRSVTAAQAASLFRDLPLRRVGIFVDAEPEELLVAAREAGLDVVQLHGDESRHYIGEIRSRSTLEIWKAIRPRDAGEFAAAVREYAPVVDGLLVDGFSEEARGGTGSRFPWEEIARARDLLRRDLPFIAAGGLQPGNVARAVSLLSPTIVDVSSGVEHSPGIKDPDSIRAFVAAVARTESKDMDPRHG